MSNPLQPWQQYTAPHAYAAMKMQRDEAVKTLGMMVNHQLGFSDPKLERQMRQWLAQNGGGTFSEQFQAQIRSGAAEVTSAFVILGSLFLGFVIVVAVLISLANSRLHTVQAEQQVEVQQQTEQVKAAQAVPWEIKHDEVSPHYWDLYVDGRYCTTFNTMEAAVAYARSHYPKPSRR